MTVPSPNRVNLVDLALLLLALSVAAALVIHVVVPSPLRRAVLDEADRRPVEIVAQSDAVFLARLMTPGDTQGPGQIRIELLDFRIEEGRLQARFRVPARTWRGHLQYGETTLAVGERFEFHSGGYKFVGTIVHVAP